MKIDRTNYEIFLMDYIDGNLDAENRRKIEQFLAANPDIADEFELANGIENSSIDADSLTKDSLFRSFSDIADINETNFEEFCIAYHEGDLEENDKVKLEAYLQKHPQSAPLFQLHKDLHLSADTEIRFPNKNTLKKHQIIPLRRYWYIAGSAVAAVFIGFSVFMLTREDKTVAPGLNKLAQVNTAIEKTVPVITPHTQSGESAAIIRTKTVQSTPSATYLAAIDTTGQNPPGTVVLAKLESESILLDPVVSEENSVIKSNYVAENIQSVSNIQHVHADLPTEEEQPRYINRETLLVSALKAGVKSYNSLTESELALNAEQDNRGRITEIKLNGENFRLERKFKQNTINKN